MKGVVLLEILQATLSVVLQTHEERFRNKSGDREEAKS